MAAFEEPCACAQPLAKLLRDYLRDSNDGSGGDDDDDSSGAAAPVCIITGAFTPEDTTHVRRMHREGRYEIRTIHSATAQLFMANVRVCVWYYSSIILYVPL